MKKLFLYIFIVLIFIGRTTGRDKNIGSRPPIPPKWIFGHWIWEDGENTETAIRQLVEDYISRNIPVGVIVIDSPWETNYNTFEFDPILYPTAQNMIEYFHSHNIKVVTWITSLINYISFDGTNLGQSPNYRHASQNGFFINDGKLYKWWKGWGSFIDYTNPLAADWWHSEMDKTLNLGIDGWKPDAGTRMFPSVANCWSGKISKKEYSRLYYKDFFEYTQSHNPNTVNFTKPLDENPGDSTYVPKEYSAASWVGDQQHTWDSKGLINALSNMFLSSKRGFHAVGSDIGGFMGDMAITKKLFIRWTQLGAFCPIMINGGHGEHRPWKFDQETLQIYKYYVALHKQLTPYLYSYAVSAHLDGQAIMRPQEGDWQYKLGEELFVSTIHLENDSRDIIFPAEADWIDFWQDDLLYSGGTVLENYKVNLEQYPIFIKAGSIIPMYVDSDITNFGTLASKGRITLVIYPSGNTFFTLYEDTDVAVGISCFKYPDSTLITFDANNKDYICRIKYEKKPQAIHIDHEEIPDAGNQIKLDQMRKGWHYDEESKKIILKFRCNGNPARVTVLDSGYTVPVTLINFNAEYENGRVRLDWTTATEKNNYGFILERHTGDELWKKIAFQRGAGTRNFMTHYSYIDIVERTGQYYYRLKQVDNNGNVKQLPTIVVKTTVPRHHDLLQNFPNPFNNATRICFQVPEKSSVLLTIMDLTGKHVKTCYQGELESGEHSFCWSGRNEQNQVVAAGVYFCVLSVSENGRNIYNESLKVALVR